MRQPQSIIENRLMSNSGIDMMSIKCVTAMGLIVRSSEGVLRKTRNLCLSCLLEGVRQRTKQINTQIVNTVLRMPHWRDEQDLNLM
jgi:hypothetical protein